MKLPFFDSLRTMAQAFSRKPRPSDPEVRNALQSLLRHPRRLESLGFFEPKTDPVQQVSRALTEVGQTLSPDQIEKLIGSLNTIEGIRSARKKFAVQVALSAVAMLAAFALIAWGPPTAERDKACFGLIGTVVGYWLR